MIQSVWITKNTSIWVHTLTCTQTCLKMCSLQVVVFSFNWRMHPSKPIIRWVEGRLLLFWTTSIISTNTGTFYLLFFICSYRKHLYTKSNCLLLTWYRLCRIVQKAGKRVQSAIHRTEFVWILLHNHTYDPPAFNITLQFFKGLVVLMILFSRSRWMQYTDSSTIFPANAKQIKNIHVNYFSSRVL